MPINYYVFGDPRYMPPGVPRGSPRLHVILMCMLMQLFVCGARNKVQFNSYEHFSEQRRCVDFTNAYLAMLVVKSSQCLLWMEVLCSFVCFI